MVAVNLLQVLFALIQGGTELIIKETKKDVFNTEIWCSQISQFTPNMCDYPSAKLHCKKICMTKEGNTGMLRCGKRGRYARSRQKRIVGGRLSSKGQWPWHVQMQVFGKPMCAGSILSEYIIITAWHCFNDMTSFNASDWKVRSNGQKLTNLFGKGDQLIQVKKIIKHKDGEIHVHNLTRKLFAKIEDDIALLVLEDPIKLDGVHRSRICLPDNKRKLSKSHRPCFVCGWGHMKFNGTLSPNLRHAMVPLVPTRTCNSEVAYNNTIDGNKVICAGYKQGGIDACYYDSGGTLVCKKKGKWYASGIVSSGYKCAEPNSYGLYTNIASYVGWIIDSILTSNQVS